MHFGYVLWFLRSTNDKTGFRVRFHTEFEDIAAMHELHINVDNGCKRPLAHAPETADYGFRKLFNRLHRCLSCAKAHSVPTETQSLASNAQPATSTLADLACDHLIVTVGHVRIGIQGSFFCTQACFKAGCKPSYIYYIYKLRSSQLNFCCRGMCR